MRKRSILYGEIINLVSKINFGVVLVALDLMINWEIRATLSKLVLVLTFNEKPLLFPISVGLNQNYIQYI